MKIKVMIVDDEVDFLEMVKLNLEETGEYQVLALSDAKNLIPELKKFNPDVLLLDLRMPDVSGSEVCDMLAEEPLGRRLPIIIISALGKEGYRIALDKLGVVGYLMKPVGREDIISKIKEILEYKEKESQ